MLSIGIVALLIIQVFGLSSEEKDKANETLNIQHTTRMQKHDMIENTVRCAAGILREKRTE